MNQYNKLRSLPYGLDRDGTFYMQDKTMQQERRAYWDKKKQSVTAETLALVAMKEYGLNPDDFENLQPPTPRTRGLAKVWSAKRKAKDEKPASQPIPEELLIKSLPFAKPQEDPVDVPAKTKKRASRSKL